MTVRYGAAIVGIDKYWNLMQSLDGPIARICRMSRLLTFDQVRAEAIRKCVCADGSVEHLRGKSVTKLLIRLD